MGVFLGDESACVVCDPVECCKRQRKIKFAHASGMGRLQKGAVSAPSTCVALMNYALVPSHLSCAGVKSCLRMSFGVEWVAACLALVMALLKTRSRSCGGGELRRLCGSPPPRAGFFSIMFGRRSRWKGKKLWRGLEAISSFRFAVVANNGVVLRLLPRGSASLPACLPSAPRSASQRRPPRWQLAAPQQKRSRRSTRPVRPRCLRNRRLPAASGEPSKRPRFPPAQTHVRHLGDEDSRADESESSLDKASSGTHDTKHALF